jgi:peptidoglycan/LPS O-acetylase OafA/YrhL
MADTDVETPTAPRRLGHIPGLGGLRGIAVLLVVMLHSGTFFPESVKETLPWHFVRGGFLGVDLFFALSGFLITSLLLEERASSGRVNYRHFYARRGLRLLPALYTMLAVYAVYSVIGDISWYKTKTTILWAVLYATNFQALIKPLSTAPGLGHLWSLAIEEQFYLIWPFIFVFALSRTRRVAPLVVGMLVAIYMIGLHRYALHESGANPLRLYVRLDTRADELLIGALAAVLWYHRGTIARVWFELLGWGGAAVFVFCMFQKPEPASFWDLGGFTLVGFAATAMVVAAVSGKWSAKPVLTCAPLLMFGEISYGLYLWHLFVFRAVQNLGASMPWWSQLIVAWIITAAVTAASWFLIEKPANRLRHRFRRVAPAPPADPPASEHLVGAGSGTSKGTPDTD